MKTETKVIVACTIILVVVLSFSMMFMLKHLEELRTSPFVYGAQKTSELNDGAYVSCSCLIEGNQNGFSFDTHNISSNDQQLKGGEFEWSLNGKNQ